MHSPLLDFHLFGAYAGLIHSSNMTFPRYLWVFPKIGVGPPNHQFYRVFHLYHPFWGFSPYFWKHPYLVRSRFSPIVFGGVGAPWLGLGPFVGAVQRCEVRLLLVNTKTAFSPPVWELCAYVFLTGCIQVLSNGTLFLGDSSNILSMQ